MKSNADVLVLGMGAIGCSVAEYCGLLIKSGRIRSVTIADARGMSRPEAAARLAALGVDIQLGSDVVCGNYDLCIASPGIPPWSELMRSARETSTEVVSELEFAYRESDIPWIAIAGTNGKTTTALLVAHLIECGGFRAQLGGVGRPVMTAVADTASADFLVAEASSFQLALTRRFKPSIAVLLNIGVDHYDWHGSSEAYVAAKSRVFANLTYGDLAVINVDDPESSQLAALLAARGVPVVQVTVRRGVGGSANLVDGDLCLETADGPMRLVHESELLLRGGHNIGNALASAAVAHDCEVSIPAIRDGLRSFVPLEHRLEPAGVVAGVEWVNDSTATNPVATTKALVALGGRPLIALLGGKSKGLELQSLASAISGLAKGVVLFGEARWELAEALTPTGVEHREVATLEEAVRAASGMATAGDVVLLSPACASFDEFSSYEHRGRVFKDLVSSLQEEQESVERPEWAGIALDEGRLRYVVASPYRAPILLDEWTGPSTALISWPQRRGLEAIEELEWLMARNAPESEYQRFFENNPEFLTFDEYVRAVPQITLVRHNGGSLVPDFMLQPYNQQRQADVLELKLPQERLVVGRQGRERFSHAVIKACAQLRQYRRFFESHANRTWFEENHAPLHAHRPAMWLVIGRRGPYDPEAFRRLECQHPVYRFKTYDDLIDEMRSRMPR